MIRPPVVLSIAGFDGSGGAGIQADLKTFSAFGCYGMSVLTVLPVQNTRGVKNCYELPAACIKEQLETVFDDIKPDAIKIGLLYNAPVIECVYDFLKKFGAEIPIVLDPVMIAKSGYPLLHAEAIQFLKEHLIPITTLLTPNLPEANALGTELATSQKHMILVAEQLLNLGSKGILLKGGHLHGDKSLDLYIDRNSKHHWIEGNRIKTLNTHGTGCTLSAAISCCLALGYPPLDACRIAKKYLLGALEQAQHWTIAQGHGPVHHSWATKPFLKNIEQG